MGLYKQFFRYVSQNILGMIGLSLYFLTDTYFISIVEGANGITALNLVLPLYNFMYAMGAMVGVGSAIRFTIAKETGSRDEDNYFLHGCIWCLMISIPFMIGGVMYPQQILTVLGADQEIIAVGTTYTRIFMCFTPCFMWNQVFNAFVRNDGAPSIAMLATLLSSLFNIVFDYVLMFPLNLGMAGAALATACSPVVGMLICLVHIRSHKSNVHFKMVVPSVKRFLYSCQVGVSAFVGEISSGVITIIFNMLILKYAGNIGVAAYGIVANCSIVAIAVFNGVANGSQPLISAGYAKQDKKAVKAVSRLSVVTSVALAGAMYLFIYNCYGVVIGIYNHDQNPQLFAYAAKGFKIYFTGFFFAGVNIVGSSIFSAVTEAKKAFIISISRGFVVISAVAFLLAYYLQMTGVWLAFPMAEALTMVMTLIAWNMVIK